MTRLCEHLTVPDTAVHVLPDKPQGAVSVRCPCCGTTGWRVDEEPMRCPFCEVAAVTE